MAETVGHGPRFRRWRTVRLGYPDNNVAVSGVWLESGWPVKVQRTHMNANRIDLRDSHAQEASQGMVEM